MPSLDEPEENVFMKLIDCFCGVTAVEADPDGAGFLRGDNAPALPFRDSGFATFECRLEDAAALERIRERLEEVGCTGDFDIPELDLAVVATNTETDRGRGGGLGVKNVEALTFRSF